MRVGDVDPLPSDPVGLAAVTGCRSAVPAPGLEPAPRVEPVGDLGFGCPVVAPFGLFPGPPDLALPFVRADEHGG